MKNFDKIFAGLIIGSAFPISLALLAGICWFYFDRNTSDVLVYIISGLVAGLITDLAFLKNLIAKRYSLPIWFIIGIYLFYNVCIYGFFMGFPVFNVFMGFIAGYYFSKRIQFKNIKSANQPQIIKRVSLFSGTIMTLICVSSGFLALSFEGAGYDIQHMLRLNFEITVPMIWGIVIAGGILLIWAQILITKITMVKTLQV